MTTPNTSSTTRKVFQCEWCSRTHRSEKAVEACRQRQEKKAALAEKHQADQERRIAKAEQEPVPDYIRRRLGREGAALVNVVGTLNREYPPPSEYGPWVSASGPRWTWVHVNEIRASQLNWPL